MKKIALAIGAVLLLSGSVDRLEAGMLLASAPAAGGGPVINTAPQLTPAGTASVGATLTCNAGTWTGTVTGHTYQFFRGGVSLGAPSGSGTTAPYTTVGADAGSSITCTDIATNGTNSTTSPASNPVSVLTTGGSVWSTLVSDKDGGVALSSTTILNDTATVSSAGWHGVRGTQSYTQPSANLRVFKLSVVSTGGASNWIGGVGIAGGSLTYPGSGAGYGVQAGVGPNADYQNGVPNSNSPSCTFSHSYAQGDTLWVAINFNNGEFYCSPDCVNWANGGSPASGVGYVGQVVGATYLPMWGGNGTTAAVATINTTPSFAACGNTLNGFSTWN